MTKTLAIILAAALTACGGGGASKDDDLCTVNLWGDSIVQAIGQRWPGQNLASSGETAPQGLARMQASTARADYVVLQYGVNDIIQGVTPEAYGAALAQMARLARAAGADVVVTGVSGTAPDAWPAVSDWSAKRDAMNAAAQTVSGVTYADWPSVPFSLSELPDGIHPNEAYRTRLVAHLARFVGCPIDGDVNSAR